MKTKTVDISHIIPGVHFRCMSRKRYQVRHYQSDKVIGWRNSIVGARELALDYHRILDHHDWQGSENPVEVK